MECVRIHTPNQYAAEVNIMLDLCMVEPCLALKANSKWRTL